MTERYTPGNGTVVSMTNLDVDCKKKKNDRRGQSNSGSMTP